jgi:hypothetical protein
MQSSTAQHATVLHQQHKLAWEPAAVLLVASMLRVQHTHTKERKSNYCRLHRPHHTAPHSTAPRHLLLVLLLR